MKNLNLPRFKKDSQGQRVFKIVIVEDSEFFNDLLSRQLENYATVLAMEKNCRFEIQSYTSPNDCLRNLKNDTNIAFIDYYLGNGVKGTEITNKIKERCWDCKVVIVSRKRNVDPVSTLPMNDDVEFVFKDRNALIKCCMILEDIVNSDMWHHELN